MTNASQFVGGWTSPPQIKLRELVRNVVETVSVDDERVVSLFKRTAVAKVLAG